MSTIAASTWNVTCNICATIRNALIVAFMGVAAFAESSGRARAASHLATMGYYEEARKIMEQKDD